MGKLIGENDERRDGEAEAGGDILEKLLALESGGSLSEREAHRAAVRRHRGYLVPFLEGADGSARRIFKMASLYGLEALPVFLSEDVLTAFRRDYLEKHGHLGPDESGREILSARRMSGAELFELVPKSSKDVFFVLAGRDGEFLFNFQSGRGFRRLLLSRRPGRRRRRKTGAAGRRTGARRSRDAAEISRSLRNGRMDRFNFAADQKQAAQRRGFAR
jgi:hypothetical protein